MKIARYIDVPDGKEAGIAMQQKYASEVIEYQEVKDENINLIAGVDGSYPPKKDKGYVGVVVIERESGKVVEEASWTGKISFPYIPGLLSLREVPGMLEAFAKLKNVPDLVIVDGNGKIHPRRFGLACHIGVCLDIPTIGCAKTPFIGEHQELENECGSSAPVYDKGELLGVAVRTQENATPLYISVGHRFSLDLAVKIAVSLTHKGNRHPLPVFKAHYLCKRIQQEEITPES